MDFRRWKHGRQLLRQYLQEIGYTDTIIDVRSTRVRSLLGLANEELSEEKNVTETEKTNSLNKTQDVRPETHNSLTTTATSATIGSGGKQSILQQMNKQNRKLSDKSHPGARLITEADTSAMATLAFLQKGLDHIADGSRILEDDDEDIGMNGEGDGKKTGKLIGHKIFKCVFLAYSY